MYRYTYSVKSNIIGLKHSNGLKLQDEQLIADAAKSIIKED